MTVSPAEIKRQILVQSDKTGIRAKLMEEPDGLTQDDIIETGQALESLTKQKGWIYVEQYMLRNMDLVGLAFSEKDDSPKKGKARAYIELMQYIDQVIKAKDMMLEKANEKTGQTSET